MLIGIYALPFVVVGLAGIAALRTGAGMIGASVVGLAAGALTLCVDRLIFGNARSQVIRTIVALLFVIPAARAGYSVTLGLTQWLVVPSVVWQQVHAIAAAVVVGAAALDRLAHPDPPDYEW